MQYVTLRRGVPRLRLLARDDSLERPAKVLESVQTFFDHVKAGRVTESDGAIVAKGSTWYYSNIGFA